MNEKKKIVVKPIHNGWINIEVIVKAVQSKLSANAFAEQRRTEGFSIRSESPYDLFDDKGPWVMRWDDAYDWIYRYAAPETARDVLERELNIRVEGELFSYVFESEVSQQTNKDSLDEFTHDKPLEFSTKPSFDSNWGVAAPDGWVKVTASVKETLKKRGLSTSFADRALNVAKDNGLKMTKFDGIWWSTPEVIDEIMIEILNK